MTDHRGSRLGTVLIALAVVFLWATSWILIKIGLEEIPPLTFAGLRYVLAFFCLVPLAGIIRLRGPRQAISRRMWGRLLALGILLYALTQGASFLALSYLPAVTVNLLWTFSSVTVALFGIIWLAEHPTRFQWTGIALATLGALVYFFPAVLPPGYLAGILAAAVGVLSNAAAAILGRDVNRSRELHPLIVTAISMGIGGTLLLITGLYLQGLPPVSLKGWAIIAWLAVVNTALAFTLWNFTLQMLSATESSIINGTMILWIPILAVLFLGERITGKELAGLAAAGVGTLIVQLQQPQLFIRLFRRTGGH